MTITTSSQRQLGLVGLCLCGDLFYIYYMTTVLLYDITGDTFVQTHTHVGSTQLQLKIK